MPELYAVKKLTIGVDKTRTVVQPGQIFTVPQEIADELSKHQPPVVVDPRSLDRRPVFSDEDSEAAAVAMNKVTGEPVPIPPGDQGQPAAVEGRTVPDGGGPNTSRGEPPAAADDPL